MSDLSPAERSLRARIAAQLSWASTEDWSARTAPAREAFLERFEREIDPTGTMEPSIRSRRAAAARKAYFARLALKSAQARRRGGSTASKNGAPLRRSTSNEQQGGAI